MASATSFWAPGRYFAVMRKLCTADNQKRLRSSCMMRGCGVEPLLMM